MSVNVRYGVRFARTYLTSQDVLEAININDDNNTVRVIHMTNGSFTYYETPHSMVEVNFKSIYFFPCGRIVKMTSHRGNKYKFVMAESHYPTLTNKSVVRHTA
jgi:hypothetical protein